MIATMTNDDDNLTADELHQLARSLAMDGSLGRHDAQRVADVLLEVAARRRHPTASRSR
jgi:hypothetical protein